jgi:hypothetical protein
VRGDFHCGQFYTMTPISRLTIDSMLIQSR